MEVGSAMTRSGRTYCFLFGGYSLAQFFIAPMYPLFLVSRGLDLFEINAVLAVYLLTVFVFDVPTGALADVAGRRSFVAGCLVRAVAYLLYTQADGFAACLAYEFIDALRHDVRERRARCLGRRPHPRRRPSRGDGRRLRARLGDRPRADDRWRGRVRLPRRPRARPAVAGRAGLFVACAAAGALLMHEPRATRPTRERPSLVQTAFAGVRTVRQAPVLLLLCGLTLVTAFAAFPVHMLWQPWLQALAGPRFALLGWIVAALNVASLAGSALLPRLLGRFRRETVLAGAALWRATMVGLLAGAGTLAPALAGLVLQEAAFGVTDPVVVAWTNEHVASAERATVLSVRSTFFTLGGAAGLVSLGLVARAFGVPAAFGVSAVLLALAAPGYALLGRAGRRGAAAPVAPEPMTAAATKVGPQALG
jgi:MFS family permease